MTTTLITGATTPLGSALAEALLERNADARVLAVGLEREPLRLRSLGQRLSYVSADLTKEREIRDLVFGPARNLAVSSVLHGAHHRSAHDTGPRVHALNVESTRTLLDLLERHPSVRRFVFVSHADVYRIDPARAVLVSERDPLDLSPDSPQRVRDRVEADLTVCARMGLGRLQIAVLRCSEGLAPDSGSQLFDYLSSRVCLRPLGFDPMLNLLSLQDAVSAQIAAIDSDAIGVVNIAGLDTLPLSRAIELSGRWALALPGALLAPLYRVRASALGMEFRYDMNYRRFHFGTVLDGRRAKDVLGYEPRSGIDWAAQRASWAARNTSM